MILYDGVESLLKGLKRPATSYEIIMYLDKAKMKRNIYLEIKNLVKDGTLEKIELEIPGFDGNFVVYVRAELLKRNEEV